MTRCVGCNNWRLKDAKDMGKHGFGLCAHGKPWQFKSPSGTCERAVKAPADVIAARVKWLDRKPSNNL